MAAWGKDEEEWLGWPGVGYVRFKGIREVSTPLPTPCPRCNHATLEECFCSEPFPVEVWGFFSDSDLGQLVIDVMAEIGRRAKIHA